jgi:FkbM family methyltransferase
MNDKARQKTYSLAFSEAYSGYEEYIGQLGSPDGNATLLTNLLDGRGTLVDIGANIGTIAVPVSVNGSCVVAVEMNPANCLRLWVAARSNGLQNFHIVQAAASDYDGLISFQGDEAWGCVNTNGQGMPAVCLQLDTLLPKFGQLPPPLILKIDVEGHEAAVLTGSLETIRELRPLVLFECIEIEGRSNDAAKSAKLILERAGYELYVLRHDTLCPKTAMEIQEGHVTDYLAVPIGRRAVMGKVASSVRQLTEEERISWVIEMALFPVENHQRHAAGVLLRWARENPQLASRAAPRLNPILLSLEHLGDVHADLRRLF